MRGPKPDLNKSLRNVIAHPSAKNVEFLKQPDNEPSQKDVDRALELRPSGLTPAEKKFWDGTAPQMVMLGRLRAHHAYAYAEYCAVVVRMAKIKRELDKNGWTYASTTRDGFQVKSHPQVAQLNDDWRKWRTLVGMFGLAPSEDRNMPTGGQRDMFGDGWEDI